jgi:hypothetical protein
MIQAKITPMALGPMDRRNVVAKVKFKDVGRNHKTWEVELPDTEPETLAKEARKAGLLSSVVDCMGGHVMVGGWRTVGTYEVLDEDDNYS